MSIAYNYETRGVLHDQGRCHFIVSAQLNYICVFNKRVFDISILWEDRSHGTPNIRRCQCDGKGTLWKWRLRGGSQHLGGKLRGTGILGVQQMRRWGERKTEVLGGCACLWLAGSRFLVDTLGTVWSPRLLPPKSQKPKEQFRLSHLRCLLLIAFCQHKPKKIHIALHSDVQPNRSSFCRRTIWFPCWILTVTAAPMRVLIIYEVKSNTSVPSPQLSGLQRRPLACLLLNVVILEAKGTENTHTHIHLKSLTWSLNMMISKFEASFWIGFIANL